MTGKFVAGSALALIAAAALSACGAVEATGTPAGGSAATTATGAGGTAPAGQRSARLVASVGRCTSGVPTVTVQGTGTVEGAPDELTIDLGVQTQSVSAAAALSANNTKARALIAELVAHGVAKAQIQTSDLSISTNTDNNGRITGYVVENDVTATVYDLSSAGTIVDAAARVAGNAIRVNDLQFGFRHPSVLLGQAHAAAVRQAAGEAAQMAAAAGAALGPLCSIQDQGGDQVLQPMVGFAAAAKASAPVQAGTQQVTATVSVAYQLASGPAH